MVDISRRSATQRPKGRRLVPCPSCRPWRPATRCRSSSWYTVASTPSSASPFLRKSMKRYDLLASLAARPRSAARFLAIQFQKIASSQQANLASVEAYITKPSWQLTRRTQSRSKRRCSKEIQGGYRQHTHSVYPRILCFGSTWTRAHFVIPILSNERPQIRQPTTPPVTWMAADAMLWLRVSFAACKPPTLRSKRQPEITSLLVQSAAANNVPVSGVKARLVASQRLEHTALSPCHSFDVALVLYTAKRGFRMA